jgi:hypothetical protein
MRIFELVPADDLLGDVRVPDMVEVGVRAAKPYLDAIAAAVQTLGVERLVDISHELDRRS